MAASGYIDLFPTTSPYADLRIRTPKESDDVPEQEPTRAATRRSIVFNIIVIVASVVVLGAMVNSLIPLNPHVVMLATTLIILSSLMLSTPQKSSGVAPVYQTFEEP